MLVTGANRGIGYETVRQLVKQGHQLILTARNEEKGRTALENLKKELPLEDNPILFQKLDVSRSSDLPEVFQFIEKRFGRLDVLINNAGIISTGKDSSEVALEEIQKTMNTNFYGPFLIAQKFIPLLKKSQDARIINVSSGMGALNGAGAGYTAYRLSKTALNGLTATMAADLAGSSVKVVSVCPGWVKSDMGGASAPRSLEQGADGIVYLATSPDVISGRFYRDGKVIEW